MAKPDLQGSGWAPGLHEDRQSAEGFVLETRVLSKPVSQNGRKCPHRQCLSLLQLSDKGVATSFSSAVKPGTLVVPFGNERIRHIHKHGLTLPWRSPAP